jgi:4-carboxymuconolactone decarboxylase
MSMLQPDPATGMPGPQRIALPDQADMNEAQKKSAQALIDGPRKAVFGPFIPLMQSPDLLDRMQKVGEFLRFGSSLTPLQSEFVTLIVARQCANQFEWRMHLPMAQKAGVPRAVLDAIAQGARPLDMTTEMATLYDFCAELQQQRGVSDLTYARLRELLDERGIVELTSLIGYFSMINLLMNVARTPPLPGDEAPLPGMPR